MGASLKVTGVKSRNQSLCSNNAIEQPVEVPKPKNAKRLVAMNVQSDGLLSLDSCCPLRLSGKSAMRSDPIAPFCTFFFDDSRKNRISATISFKRNRLDLEMHYTQRVGWDVNNMRNTIG